MRELLSSKQLDAQGASRVRNQGAGLLRALNQPKVDMQELMKQSFIGIPDEIKGLRPLIWRVLLKYLPEDTALWD